MDAVWSRWANHGEGKPDVHWAGREPAWGFLRYPGTMPSRAASDGMGGVEYGVSCDPPWRGENIVNVREDGGSIRRRATLALVALAAAAMATTVTVALSGSERETIDVSAQDDDEPDGEGSDDVRTIRVPGRATVDVVPDVATVTMGAQHTAPSADEALDTVSERINAIIRLLRAAGIDERDIQTSSLSVLAQYGGEQGEEITGYQASNTVTVRSSDLEGLGGLIDRVSNEAGDQFRLDGVAFSVDDPDGALADVRADAVADARTKAGQLVTGEDLEVGEIRSIVESGDEGPIIYDEMALDRASAEQVSIEPGSQELVVNVTVVFELT